MCVLRLCTVEYVVAVGRIFVIPLLGVVGRGGGWLAGVAVGVMGVAMVIMVGICCDRVLRRRHGNRGDRGKLAERYIVEEGGRRL